MTRTTKAPTGQRKPDGTLTTQTENQTFTMNEALLLCTAVKSAAAPTTLCPRSGRYILKCPLLASANDWFLFLFYSNLIYFLNVKPFLYSVVLMTFGNPGTYRSCVIISRFGNLAARFESLRFAKLSG